MCHVVSVCGDNGTVYIVVYVVCGVPALTGAVVRTLEPPSAVTVKWSPAPAPACALLCPVCSDQGENISPAQRPPDGEDGIHYTIYILSLYFIV